LQNKKQIKISGPGKADVEMEQAREFYTGLGSNIKSDQNTIIDDNRCLGHPQGIKVLTGRPGSSVYTK